MSSPDVPWPRRSPGQSLWGGQIRSFQGSIPEPTWARGGMQGHEHSKARKTSRGHLARSTLSRRTARLGSRAGLQPPDTSHERVRLNRDIATLPGLGLAYEDGIRPSHTAMGVLCEDRGVREGRASCVTSSPPNAPWRRCRRGGVMRPRTRRPACTGPTNASAQPFGSEQ